MKYGTCEHCGANGAILRVNPYEQEINDTTKEEYICDVCFDDLCDDI